MKDITNILLVLKTGGRYSVADVMLLVENMFKYTAGVRIYCLTDLVSEKVIFKDITFIPIPSSYPGWWSKLWLFSPEFEYLRPFLYMDLDTLINGDIASIFPTAPELFYTIRDFYQPQNLASGIMWIPADSNKVEKIWNEWEKNPFKHIKTFKGDQDFIGRVVKADSYFSNELVVSFKPKRRWLLERPKAPIVCFHGVPSIWEASESVVWVNDYIKG